jgi:hypothetical protein
MAKSTAEKLALELPKQKKGSKRKLAALLWSRNIGYLNRKTTSILLDFIEILSLALLADTQSIKNFYVIWIIFYLAQGTLESLFYSARKQFVFKKEHPSNRILIYVHFIVMIVPLFFLLYGFERLTKNDITFGYLLYKSISFLISIIFNLLNFKVQTFSRVFYPPRLNWYLILLIGIVNFMIHYFFSSYVSFYLVIGTILVAKTFQEIIAYKMGKSLKESILWHLKQSRIVTSNSMQEFFTLIMIDLFLPISVFILVEKRIHFKDIFHISILYMAVKLCLRLSRSMILEFKKIGTKNKKNLFLLSYILIILFHSSLLLSEVIPGKIIYLSYIHFNFLFIWNFNYSNCKMIVVFLLVSLVSIYFLEKGPLIVLFVHMIWIIRIYVLFFSNPKNLLKPSEIIESENTFLITFKKKTNWISLSKMFPEIYWAPLGKKKCLVDSSSKNTNLHKLIEIKSFDIESIENINSENKIRPKSL